MTGPGPIAAGAWVYVHTQLLPRTSFGRVERFVGVAPDGLDIYRIRLESGLVAFVAGVFLADVGTLGARERACYAPAVGHA